MKLAYKVVAIHVDGTEEIIGSADTSKGAEILRNLVEDDFTNGEILYIRTPSLEELKNA